LPVDKSTEAPVFDEGLSGLDDGEHRGNSSELSEHDDAEFVGYGENSSVLSEHDGEEFEEFEKDLQAAKKSPKLP